jgi:RNA polymerase sigma-70 factor, ECF subfamily
LALNLCGERGVWHLYEEHGGMQELVLKYPGSLRDTSGGSSSGDSAGGVTDNPLGGAASRKVSNRTSNLGAGEHVESDAEVRAAFEGLLAECGPLAYRVARGVLRNDADAEDVAQEALLKAFRRFHRLRERQRFRAWLVRIAFRLALDRARSAKRREERETLWSRPERRAPAENAEDLAARGQFAERLEVALAELPEKLRLVLLLAAMQGHTLEEVAAMLAVPVGTVKSRLFFARKELAEKLRCYANKLERR